MALEIFSGLHTLFNMEDMDMKKFLALIAFAAAILSCVKTAEEETQAEVYPPATEITSIEAYIRQDSDSATKTEYTIGADKAAFAWVADDHIDVVAEKSGVSTSVVFTLTDKDANLFKDGQVSGAAALSQLSGYTLGDWAFYPSRVSEDAQAGGYALDWSCSSGVYTVDLPTSITPSMSNPLAVIPLAGKIDADGKYAFTQMAGALAVTVNNLPEEVDYISVTHPDAALAGSFTVDMSGTAAQINLADVQAKADEGVTLHFSGLSGTQTFYLPLPVGTIPAGMTITIGSTTDEEKLMSITTKVDLTIPRGTIIKAPAFNFTLPDEGWTKVDDGTFKDDFIWAQLSWGSNTVPVTIERSSLHPAKYRINNPYTVACTQFGYTPYAGGAADDYFVFYVEDGSVRYGTFKTGVEDKTSGGKAMMVTYSKVWSASKKGTATYVVSADDAGVPVEVVFGGVYSDYTDKTYMYTRDGEGHSSTQRMHLYFTNGTPATESWTAIGTGRYLDEFLWKANSFPPYAVSVNIERSTLYPTHYRINNPYTVAATAFQRTAQGTGDDYMYINVDESTGYVTFGKVVTGMSKGTEAKNFAIADAATWESVKSSGSAIAAANSKLVSGTASAPKELQMYSAYYDSDAVSYFYTNNTLYKHLYFPAYYEGETWTDYMDATYVDGTYDGNINGTDAIGTVAVSVQQSSIDPYRFRIANPYRANVASTYLKSTYDEYLYFNYGNFNDLAYMEPFRPGVAMDYSSHPTYELGIWHPVDANLTSGASSYGGSDFAQNNVVSKTSDDKPAKFRFGCYYFDIGTPTYSYRYTRQGSGRSDSERIFITFDVSDKAVITPRQYPMVPAYHNPVEVLTLPNGTLEKLVVKITGLDDLSVVSGLRLYQGGWMDSDYIAPDASGVVTMTSFTNATVSGDIDLNFWVTDALPIGSSVRFLVQEVVVDGVSLPISQDVTLAHYPGIVLNTGGNEVNVRGASETVASFRIPALVTTNAGTLIAAYDVRYASSVDLQGDIDVGMKRSTDGGKTWSELQLIMDPGEYGGLSQSLNGIGDPCLLVDETTGDIYCFAIWAHDHAGTRLLSYAGVGYDITDTPQFMMTKSTDDGQTWSEMVNLTRQLKKYDWRATFQGPGRGITMADGTLVIPMQHQENGVLNSGIAYSKDHGLTWHTHNMAHSTTSEACVAEIEPGKLLLSMRDETNSHYRRAFVTENLGRSWSAHSSNGKMMEPTCEASMIHVNAADNSLGQDLLLFSNPHSTSGRSNMSIQASLDKGETWPYVTTVDAGSSLGYTCLTMVDQSTVGILYESSRGNILFQAIPLSDIVK